MDLKQLVMLGLQVSIVCTVFGYGLKTETGALLDVLRRPALLVRSVFCLLVIVPALAFALTRFFGIRHEVEVALVALAISPVPPLLPMKETKAGGRISFGLGLLALLALLSIVTIPLGIEVLERLFNRPLEVAPFAVARLALITVLVPLVAGIVVQTRAPMLAERIAPGLSIGAKLLLVGAAIALLAGVWRSVWEATGQGAVLAIAIFIVGGLAVGHLLGGPERETSLVLGMSSACRHPAIAFAIASANFPDQRFGGAIILYLLLSLLIGVPYVRWNRSRIIPALLTLCFVVGACSDPTPTPATASAPSAAAPLTSWSQGAAKSAIVDFVERTTRQGTPDFVPQAERIAVFDNDGTLWAEQPMYFQLAFALDRIRALAPDHPEWKTTQPFKGAMEGDLKTVLAGGEQSVLQVVAASHSGNTSEEFEAIVTEWIGSATHPVTKRAYVEMVYQPMLEVLTYLRAKGYKTFIVSGGGVEFMRPWVERVYGVPPEQVVGSRVKVKYEVRESGPVLLRLPEIDFIDDKAGKPVGIHQAIGRRPTIAFGNSDGDFEMLEWTTSAKGPRLGVIVHHTDAEREWAYDRDSHIGQLVRGLDEAPKRGWVIVDMKRDWRIVYPEPR